MTNKKDWWQCRNCGTDNKEEKPCSFCGCTIEENEEIRKRWEEHKKAFTVELKSNNVWKCMCCHINHIKTEVCLNCGKTKEDTRKYKEQHEIKERDRKKREKLFLVEYKKIVKKYDIYISGDCYGDTSLYKLEEEDINDIIERIE